MKTPTPTPTNPTPSPSSGPASHPATDHSTHADPASMADTEFDRLDALLDRLRDTQEEVPQWEFCEGFMAALLCCRRPIPPAEYFPALLGGEGDVGDVGDEAQAAATGAEALLPFPDPADRAEFQALWTRRWHEVEQALDAPVETLEDPRVYAPEVMDVRGAIAALGDEERAAMDENLADETLPSFAQVWALGFMYAVETWAEEWAPPRDKDAAEVMEASLEKMVVLTEDDMGEPSISMFGEDTPPSVSQERLNAYGEAIWAVYDLRDVGRSLGPRVETVRKAATPGRNDPCWCGSGKKFKRCHGAEG
jgi:uncharacterized protein